MSEVEKIRRYIERCGAPYNPLYAMGMNEASAVVSEMGPIEAASLAFIYGKAKGYRQAKAERRKEGQA